MDNRNLEWKTGEELPDLIAWLAGSPVARAVVDKDGWRVTLIQRRGGTWIFSEGDPDIETRIHAGRCPFVAIHDEQGPIEKLAAPASFGVLNEARAWSAANGRAVFVDRTGSRYRSEHDGVRWLAKVTESFIKPLELAQWNQYGPFRPESRKGESDPTHHLLMGLRYGKTEAICVHMERRLIQAIVKVEVQERLQEWQKEASASAITEDTVRRIAREVAREISREEIAATDIEEIHGVKDGRSDWRVATEKRLKPRGES